MPDGIVKDVCAVWDEGKDALWSEQLVSRLVDFRPEVYGELTVTEFGAAMRIAGVSTVRIGRRIDGKFYCRYGLRLADLRARRRAQIQVVYFVEREGLVKIGTTSNLPVRLHCLNRGDSAISGMTIGPVDLLATMPGGPEVESALHRLFARLRYDGEWFLLDEPLVGFVRSVARAEWPWRKP